MKKRMAVLILVALTGSIAAIAAQQPAAEKKLSFEVVSIRPAAPSSVRNRTTIISPRRITMQNINLIWLAYYAYGAGLSTGVRVESGPDWANRDGFDIQGLAPQNSKEREFRLMVRTMLEERFALKVRTERREGSDLGLVPDRSDGKRGPNVQPWSGSCEYGMPNDDDDPTIPRCGGSYRPPRIVLEGVSMFNVAEMLSLPQSRNLLGNVVTDRTGLNGRFNMKLAYDFT